MKTNCPFTSCYTITQIGRLSNKSTTTRTFIKLVDNFGPRGGCGIYR